VLDAPVEDRIDEREVEALGRPDAADRGQRSAEHQRSVAERAVLALVLRKQLARRAHRRDGAVLVGARLAADPHRRMQLQPIPVAFDFRQRPPARRDRLVAHLLGDRDAVGLDLAVGVIRSGADPELAVGVEDHELDLARRVAADRFDAARSRDAARADAVVHRRSLRARHADRLEFDDVVLHRSDVAAGPAGDHGAGDRRRAARRLALGREFEFERMQGIHRGLPSVNRSYTNCTASRRDRAMGPFPNVASQQAMNRPRSGTRQRLGKGGFLSYSRRCRAATSSLQPKESQR